MTRWLLTGSEGFVAQDLRRRLHDQDVVALSHSELDVTRAVDVSALLSRLRPDVVVNCAGLKDVDAIEESEQSAYAVNVLGAANVANACSDISAVLVHLSADYVFDGAASAPITEDAPARPISAYGRTKLAGEQVAAAAHELTYVVRSSWLFGLDGPCFLTTMLRLERERETVTVVDDQFGSPTWVRHLCDGIVSLAGSGAKPGIYHCVNDGAASWFEVAQAIFAQAGADQDRVRPVPSDTLARRAARPRYTVLSRAKWLTDLPASPHWREALQACFGAGGSHR